MTTLEATSLQIETHDLKKAALQFRAINHKIRSQMMKVIYSNQQMDVTSIYVNLRLEQSVASQHLAILRKAGLVTTTRDGKRIYYAVCQQRLDQLHAIAKELSN